MKLRKGHWISTENLTREKYDQFCMKLIGAGCKRGEYDEFTSYDELVIRWGFTKVGWGYGNCIKHTSNTYIWVKSVDKELTIEQVLDLPEVKPHVPHKTYEQIIEDFNTWLSSELTYVDQSDPLSREMFGLRQAYFKGYLKGLEDESNGEN